MGLKESLKRLLEDEERDKKLSLKREVKKELTRLKKEKVVEKRCSMCGENAAYSVKGSGSNDWYCRDCAKEYFGDLKGLKKLTKARKDSKKNISDTGHDDKIGLYFITNNDNKFREISQIIPEIKQLKLDLDEIQEIDAKKIIEHKLMEAKKVYDSKPGSQDKARNAFIVEDTSLYLDCLDGLPGPLIKWFLQTIGNVGLYGLALKFKNNKAEARTLIGYYYDGKIKYFQGIVKGKIVSPRYSNFGWDAIFMPEGYPKVMGEMTTDEKNRISMRGKAMQKLNDYLDR